MSLQQSLNAKANVKKSTTNDIPYSPLQPIISSYYGTSTAGQTVINLTFSVYASGTNQNTDAFWLMVDGKKLTLGTSSTNDYYFTAVAADGSSSQVTLNQALVVGLNLQAYKMGLKKETEFQTDNRFVQLYEYLGDGLQPFVNQNENILTATSSAPWSITTYPGTFYSSIVGRAPITDMSQDLKPRMGIERISTQTIYQLQNEFGPNGEPVWSTPNDQFGQIRLVGNWSQGISSAGQYPSSATAGAYVEITFYGTGLNLLSYPVGDVNSPVSVTVDGTQTLANIYTAAQSSVIGNRNYSTNVVLPAASGLSLGIHTVSLKMTAFSVYGFNFQGFEVINESSSVKIQPGVGYVSGKKNVLTSQSTFNYAAPVTGTRGGRVVVYQAADGTIGQAWQATNSSAAALGYSGTGYSGNADHTNEEVVRSYYYREFGDGRTDDFSRSTSSSQAAAFTLDDGTTTLTSDAVSTSDPNIIQNANGNYISFTFIGTGLDLELSSTDVNHGGTVVIDGTTIVTDTAFASNIITTKIASGLPYGTHVAKFYRTATKYLRIKRFIVYQPKTPSIPSGAIQVGSYNVMATYAAGSNPMIGSGATSTGILFKTNMRELSYVGAWGGGILSSPGLSGGYYVVTNTNSDYIQYSFFGTGFEIYASSASGAAVTITLNGTAYTGAATTTNSGTWTSGTWNPTPGGNTLQISGLTLGLYTVKINCTNATTYQTNIFGFSIITPIHSPKSNLYADLQNALPVGSCGISDDRKLTPVKDVFPVQKAWAQAVGVTANPTVATATFVPMPDMSVTIKTGADGKPSVLDISWVVGIQGVAGAFVNGTQAYVDGVPVGVQLELQYNNSYPMPHPGRVFVPVAPGTHKVDIYWGFVGSVSTATADGTRRILNVREL